MNAKFDELIGSFVDNEIGLCEHFLTKTLAKLLQQHLQELDNENRMLPAGIGNDIIKDPLQKKRGDRIFWLDKKTKNINELAFLDQIENFIEYLNKTCYTGINAYEFHYALYDAGTFYKRHRDQFKNNQDRKYTLISYLNDDWKDTDGGELIIYQAGKAGKILPTMQKAVFFRSSELEHEVSVSPRPRMSISGWLKSN